MKGTRTFYEDPPSCCGFVRPRLCYCRAPIPKIPSLTLTALFFLPSPVHLLGFPGKSLGGSQGQRHRDTSARRRFSSSILKRSSRKHQFWTTSGLRFGTGQGPGSCEALLLQTLLLGQRRTSRSVASLLISQQMQVLGRRTLLGT